MADTSEGPVSTMPGSKHAVPPGATCDDHPDRMAIHRIQGETDSSGCEYMDLCDECYKEMRAAQEIVDRSGVCDWCRRHKPKLSKRRDFDEGTAGRIYDVCDDCIAEEQQRLSEELEDSGINPDLLGDIEPELLGDDDDYEEIHDNDN